MALVPFNGALDKEATNVAQPSKLVPFSGQLDQETKDTGSSVAEWGKTIARGALEGGALINRAALGASNIAGRIAGVSPQDNPVSRFLNEGEDEYQAMQRGYVPSQEKDMAAGRLIPVETPFTRNEAWAQQHPYQTKAQEMVEGAIPYVEAGAVLSPLGAGALPAAAALSTHARLTNKMMSQGMDSDEAMLRATLPAAVEGGMFYGMHLASKAVMGGEGMVAGPARPGMPTPTAWEEGALKLGKPTNLLSRVGREAAFTSPYLTAQGEVVSGAERLAGTMTQEEYDRRPGVLQQLGENALVGAGFGAIGAMRESGQRRALERRGLADATLRGALAAEVEGKEYLPPYRGETSNLPHEPVVDQTTSSDLLKRPSQLDPEQQQRLQQQIQVAQQEASINAPGSTISSGSIPEYGLENGTALGVSDRRGTTEVGEGRNTEVTAQTAAAATTPLTLPPGEAQPNRPMTEEIAGGKNKSTDEISTSPMPRDQHSAAVPFDAHGIAHPEEKSNGVEENVAPSEKQPLHKTIIDAAKSVNTALGEKGSAPVAPEYIHNAAMKLARTVKNFSEFVKGMVQRFGEAVKQHAVKLWNFTKEKLKEERGSFSLKDKNDATEKVAPQKELGGFVNHSGGADGADTAWGDIGAEYGVKSNHYHGGAAKTPKGNTVLPREQLDRADADLKKANATLKRAFPSKNPAVNDLLRRNWYQVTNADAIFAVGKIIDKVKFPKDKPLVGRAVEGGTGWAVQLGIDKGKPVHVFDQEKGVWFTFDRGAGKFIAEAPPKLTKNFAGIGTRDLNSIGEAEIRATYERTAGRETVPVKEMKGAHVRPKGERPPYLGEEPLTDNWYRSIFASKGIDWEDREEFARVAGFDSYQDMADSGYRPTKHDWSMFLYEPPKTESEIEREESLYAEDYNDEENYNYEDSYEPRVNVRPHGGGEEKDTGVTEDTLISDLDRHREKRTVDDIRTYALDKEIARRKSIREASEPLPEGEEEGEKYRSIETVAEQRALKNGSDVETERQKLETENFDDMKRFQLQLEKNKNLSTEQKKRISATLDTLHEEGYSLRDVVNDVLRMHNKRSLKNIENFPVELEDAATELLAPSEVKEAVDSKWSKPAGRNSNIVRKVPAEEEKASRAAKKRREARASAYRKEYEAFTKTFASKEQLAENAKKIVAAMEKIRDGLGGRKRIDAKDVRLHEALMKAVDPSYLKRREGETEEQRKMRESVLREQVRLIRSLMKFEIPRSTPPEEIMQDFVSFRDDTVNPPQERGYFPPSEKGITTEDAVEGAQRNRERLKPDEQEYGTTGWEDEDKKGFLDLVNTVTPPLSAEQAKQRRLDFEDASSFWGPDGHEVVEVTLLSKAGNEYTRRMTGTDLQQLLDRDPAAVLDAKRVSGAQVPFGPGIDVLASDFRSKEYIPNLINIAKAEGVLSDADTSLFGMEKVKLTKADQRELGMESVPGGTVVEQLRALWRMHQNAPYGRVQERLEDIIRQYTVPLKDQLLQKRISQMERLDPSEFDQQVSVLKASGVDGVGPEHLLQLMKAANFDRTVYAQYMDRVRKEGMQALSDMVNGSKVSYDALKKYLSDRKTGNLPEAAKTRDETIAGGDAVMPAHDLFGTTPKEELTEQEAKLASYLGVKVGTFRGRVAEAIYGKVADLFGAKLVVARDFTGDFKGAYFPRSSMGPVIVVNADAKLSFTRIFAHELFHHALNSISPETYAAFRGAIRDAVDEKAWENALRTLKRRSGKGMDAEPFTERTDYRTVNRKGRYSSPMPDLTSPDRYSPEDKAKHDWYYERITKMEDAVSKLKEALEGKQGPDRAKQKQQIARAEKELNRLRGEYERLRTETKWRSFDHTVGSEAEEIVSAKGVRREGEENVEPLTGAERDAFEEELYSELFSEAFTKPQFWDYLARTAEGRSLKIRMLSRIMENAAKITEFFKTLPKAHRAEFEVRELVRDWFGETESFSPDETIVIDGKPDLHRSLYSSGTKESLGYGGVFNALTQVLDEAYVRRELGEALRHSEVKHYRGEEYVNEAKKRFSEAKAWTGEKYHDHVAKDRKGYAKAIQSAENLLRSVKEYLTDHRPRSVYAHFMADPVDLKLAEKVQFYAGYEVGKAKVRAVDGYQDAFRGMGIEKQQKLIDDLVRGNVNVSTPEGFEKAQKLGYTLRQIEALRTMQKVTDEIGRKLKEIDPKLELHPAHYGLSIRWRKERGNAEPNSTDLEGLESEFSRLSGSEHFIRAKNLKLSTAEIARKYGLEAETFDPHQLFLNYVRDAHRYISLHELHKEGLMQGRVRIFDSPWKARDAGFYAVGDSATKIIRELNLPLGYKVRIGEDKFYQKGGQDAVFGTREEAQHYVDYYSPVGEFAPQIEEMTPDAQVFTKYVGVFNEEGGEVASFPTEAEASAWAAAQKGNFTVKPVQGTPDKAEVARYYYTRDLAHLLNVSLSRDLIRKSKAGSAILNFKNGMTGMELAMSMYHALTEGHEMISSGMAHKWQRLAGDRKAGKAVGIADFFRAMNPFQIKKESRELDVLLKSVMQNPDLATDADVIRKADQLLGTTNVDLKDVIDQLGLRGLLFAGQDRSLRPGNYEGQRVKYRSKEDALSFKDGKVVISNEKTFEPKVLMNSIRQIFKEEGEKHPDSPWAAAFHSFKEVAFHAPTSWLMEELIPKLKFAQAAKEYTLALDKNRDAILMRPELKAELARDVVAFVEDRFGEKNWNTMWMDKTVKSSLQFLFRSYSWAEGTAKALGKAGIDLTKWGWFNVAKGGALGNKAERYYLTDKGWWGIAAFVTHFATVAAIKTAYNLAVGLSGDDEVPDDPETSWLTKLMFVRTDRNDPSKLMALPGYPTEAYKIAMHLGLTGTPAEPSKVITGRFNSLLTNMWETYQNQDFRGETIRDGNPLKQALQGAWHVVGIAPISFSTIGKMYRDEGLQLTTLPIGLLGMNDAPAAAKRSVATNLAWETRRKEYKGKETTPEENAEKDALKRALYAYQQGDRSKLDALIKEGKVSSQNVKKELVKYPRLGGKENPSYQDELSRAFKGLTMEGKLKVFKSMSEAEKKKHKGELMKSYFRMSASRERSPEDKRQVRGELKELGFL